MYCAHHLSLSGWRPSYPQTFLVFSFQRKTSGFRHITLTSPFIWFVVPMRGVLPFTLLNGSRCSFNPPSTQRYSCLAWLSDVVMTPHLLWCRTRVRFMAWPNTSYFGGIEDTHHYSSDEFQTTLSGSWLPGISKKRVNQSSSSSV